MTCYYIQNEQAVRGKAEIDLTTDPPPDLAIEVDNTSSSIIVCQSLALGWFVTKQVTRR